MKENISEAKLLSANWFPKKIYEVDNKWYIDWKFIGDKRFTEPFYEDTMRQVSSESNRFISSIEILSAPQSLQTEPIEPALFIFHISRCGSTLLTQMLSQIQENIVLSEASVIDQLIRSGLPKKRKELYLKNLIHLLCRKRFREERYAFIKFDAWHLLYVEEIRSVFPDIPILILYRNPTEVLFSHAKRRGQHMVPGFFRETVIPWDEKEYADLNGYAVSVLQKYFEALQQYSSYDRCFLLNYNELPDAIWPLFHRHMEINWSAEKINEMKKRAGFYSKDKNLVFRGDTQPQADFLPVNKMDALNLMYKELDTLRQT